MVLSPPMDPSFPEARAFLHLDRTRSILSKWTVSSLFPFHTGQNSILVIALEATTTLKTWRFCFLTRHVPHTGEQPVSTAHCLYCIALPTMNENEKRACLFAAIHALQQFDDDCGAIIAGHTTSADAADFVLKVEDRRAGTEGRSWVIERNSRTWVLTIIRFDAIVSCSFSFV